ncbi:MAG: hypothetical protein GF390_04185 [Candidatus Pacebacteria bacterium]|nr:hypothetical protein [Candidatus Paceibacterota bacterium]
MLRKSSKNNALLALIILAVFIGVVIKLRFSSYENISSFPLDNPDGIYIIRKAAKSTKLDASGQAEFVFDSPIEEVFYFVEYREEEGGLADHATDLMLVGNSKVDLEPFVNHQVQINGEFRTHNSQCIVDTCSNLGETRGTLFINEVTMVRSGLPDPGFSLPINIDPGQLQKFLQFANGDMYALVVQPSMNFPVELDSAVASEKPFVGVLSADLEGQRWRPWVEIKELNLAKSSGNNPYYLWFSFQDEAFYLSVVDQNGAGSGEGVMKVFVQSGQDQKQWSLVGCYYYTPGLINKESYQQTYDYFSLTSKTDLYQQLDLERCQDAVEAVFVTPSFANGL